METAPVRKWFSALKLCTPFTQILSQILAVYGADCIQEILAVAAIELVIYDAFGEGAYRPVVRIIEGGWVHMKGIYAGQWTYYMATTYIIHFKLCMLGG